MRAQPSITRTEDETPKKRGEGEDQIKEDDGEGTAPDRADRNILETWLRRLVAPGGLPVQRELRRAGTADNLFITNPLFASQASFRPEDKRR